MTSPPPDRQPDPRKTLVKAMAVIVMLGIALCGVIWSVWMLKSGNVAK
jgi:hypothetical protein